MIMISARETDGFSKKIAGGESRNFVVARRIRRRIMYVFACTYPHVGPRVSDPTTVRSLADREAIPPTSISTTRLGRDRR